MSQHIQSEEGLAFGRGAGASGLTTGLGPEGSEEGIRPPSDEKTSEWIAALAAAGFDYRLSQDEAGWVVHVTREAAAAARAELEAYEADNKDWPPAPRIRAEEPVPEDAGSAWWACGFLVVFYLWLGPYRPQVPLLERAAADTERILAGEWWRAVTALTLHANGPHLLGNVISLFFLGRAVCRVMGTGLGWGMILAAGVAGNLAVAWILRSDQVGVGASTSSFGALGIMAAYQAIRKLRRIEGLPGIWDRLWIPLGAGLGLLAILGTGPQSDLAAHAFGFAFGMIPGALFGWLGIASRTLWLDRILQLACLGAILQAWHAAAVRRSLRQAQSFALS